MVRVVVTYVICALVLFSLFFLLGSGTYIRLLQDGQATEGVVVGKDPANHNLLRYAYEVSGRRYERGDQGGTADPGKPYAQVAIGDRIPVVYLRSEPQVAVVGDPRRHLVQGLVGAAVGALTFSAVVMLVIWRANRRWQQSR
jgi:hypothetical protein